MPRRERWISSKFSSMKRIAKSTYTRFAEHRFELHQTCRQRILEIMFRCFSTILLIAGFLTCPARCSSCSSGIVTVKIPSPAGCSCCHCDVSSPISEVTDNCPPADAPGNDCTCPNCICEGATLQDSIKLPNAETQQLCFYRGAAEIQLGIIVPVVLEFARETQDCCRYHCGRDARIAHHCWLI